MVHPSPELIARFDCRGPRYTSYPTAAVFDDGFPPASYRRALRELGKDERDVSVYVHLPFCRQRCHYCACNVIVTNSPPRADVYLDRLERELALVREAIGAQVAATQLHLGGGTPTFLSVEQLARLLDLLAPRFDWGRCVERAVEVDPRVTSVAQLELLAGRGFNRISLGVQDFDSTVQTAIGREQSVALTGDVVAHARRLGFTGVNLDLVYGLPHQTPASLAGTLEEVVALRPDRIALYGYAHLPQLRPAQRLFETRGDPLPRGEERIALFHAAVERLLAAGYVHLGLDHFALPSDELAQAAGDGRLHRNFMGYTVRHADDVIALGVSAISEVGGTFAQNYKEEGPYAAALDAGELPVSRGWISTDDDRRRRVLIMRVMNGRDLPRALCAAYPDAARQLDDFAAAGLLDARDDGWHVTELGRYFLRNVAMVFDAYLDTNAAYSRTV